MQTNNPQAEAAEVMMRNSWITGFTPQAELWNGRLAMIGFVSAIAIELLMLCAKLSAICPNYPSFAITYRFPNDSNSLPCVDLFLEKPVKNWELLRRF